MQNDFASEGGAFARSGRDVSSIRSIIGPRSGVLTGARDEMAAQMQVAEARATGYEDVRAGRVGMIVELPLENSEVNVRTL